MTVPLNINTPPGQPYTVNHRIHINSCGRLTFCGGSSAKVADKGHFLSISLLHATLDATLEMGKAEARELAENILKALEEPCQPG